MAKATIGAMGKRGQMSEECKKSASEKRRFLVPVVRYSVGGGVEVLGRQGQMWPILINLCSMQPGRILPNLGLARGNIRS